MQLSLRELTQRVQVEEEQVRALTHDVHSAGLSDVIATRKQSVDGTIAPAVLAVVVTQASFRLIRELLVKYLETRALRSIRIGNIEVRNPDESSAQKLYAAIERQLSSGAWPTENDKND